MTFGGSGSSALVLVHGTKAGAYVLAHVDNGEVPVKNLKKLLLMVTVTMTFTITAAGAGHSSAPVTRPAVNCSVRIV